MRNVARGVGLGGSATLIFACVMAAPAVAEMKINVPAIHVDAPSSTVHPPLSPGFKAVVPPISKGRPSSVNAHDLNSQKGGGDLISVGGKFQDSASPVFWRGASAPNHSDPSLHFTLASLAGAHRNQLNDDAPTGPPDPGPPGVYQQAVALSNAVQGAAVTVGKYVGMAVGTASGAVSGFLSSYHQWSGQ
jgi:hypothetical protein